MILEIVVVGPLAVNCLIVGCEKTKIGAIIDPGDETAAIVKTVEELGLDIKYILLTHGHIDHLAEVPRLKDKFNAEFLMHESDSFLVEHASTQASMYGLSNPGNPKPDRYLAEGDTVSLGELKIEVFHTPGHSPGSITYFVEDKLFVGDLIFAGSIGRTDLPQGNYEQLIKSVETKIFTKPDSTEIYPGHGPSSTVGTEKATNPFFNR
ncbi:MBL fold metallo-hydrolase [candidate division KSB1 bacterium]|nr:MBL fold metallo-hydrolase [candidate division KSB1 bacterium]